MQGCIHEGTDGGGQDGKELEDGESRLPDIESVDAQRAEQDREKNQGALTLRRELDLSGSIRHDGKPLPTSRTFTSKDSRPNCRARRLRPGLLPRGRCSGRRVAIERL